MNLSDLRPVVGLLFWGTVIVGVVWVAYVAITQGTSRPTRKLTDDERIERMEREKRLLEETDEWMRKKLEADRWDKEKGR